MATQSFKIKENRKAVTSAEVTFDLIGGPEFTLIPGDILSKLGIEPYRKMVFDIWTEDEENELDGRMIEICRRVGEAYFELNGVGATSPVVFGEENDTPTIGECTITALGFRLDLSAMALEPMDMNL